MKPMECPAEDSVHDRCLPATGNNAGGFTRIELLVVAASIALLAVTLLPALAKNRVQPQGIQCLNNLRQITMAWMMYPEDNNGILPFNTPDAVGFSGNISDALAHHYNGWCMGWMGFGNADSTDIRGLTDPRVASLSGYLKSTGVFKCPADQSHGLTGPPRLRSYSMNQAIGGSTSASKTMQQTWLDGTGGSPPGIPWRIYIKESDLKGPVPSDLWVLVEEHPDWINGPVFGVQMPLNPSSVQAYWIDVPAKYHANACGFSFADGHSELHRWLFPASIPPATYSGTFSKGQRIGGADVWWVGHHTSARTDGLGYGF